MKLVYLNPLKEDILKQALDDIQAQSGVVAEQPERSEHQNDEIDLYSDEAYRNEDSVIQTEDIKELDDFGLYDFDIDYLVTIKAARLAKNSQSPFAALYEPKERKTYKESEMVYKTEKRMTYNEYKQNIRFGFIRASDTFKYAKMKPDKVKELLGLAHGEFPIRRKKGFNQKKVGYIKLNIPNETADYYVEVVKSRGILRWLWWILIILALLLLLRSCNMSDWNWNALNPYRTETTDVQDASQLSIQHRAEVNNDGGRLNLGLTSESVDGISFVIKVYAGSESQGDLIYESGRMNAGDTLATIDIQGQIDVACTLVCEVYKDSGQYIGSLESCFTIK